ncbi:MAG: histidine kinase [Myxococcaceae bacterium]|nr:histidine kinase [Myxococcaceae bacterium]
MQTVEQLIRQKGREVWTVSPEASVHDAVDLMCERNIGAVVVCTGEDVVGVLSERDCVRRVMQHGRSARETKVRQVMSNDVRTVGLRDTIDHCMQQMTDERVRHLPVLDDGMLVGMVSVGDVVKAQLKEQESLISGLESYIHGASASVRPPAF